MRRGWVAVLALVVLGWVAVRAQSVGMSGDADTDRDGLSDAVEGQLLARFAPRFMISRGDCSVQPAQFAAGVASPTVVEDDGTIYGQASPYRGQASPRGGEEVELRYFHLWRRDCGEMGHRLDTEHVSVLVKRGRGLEEARAVLWYAAAHEDTICDAGHMVRAAAIHAEDRGATVWISAGKHASFLSEAMCRHGCGGDRCEAMVPLVTKQVVNLGEVGAPMGGIVWLRSAEWPLREKMERTDFSEARVARVERLPETALVWATPGKRPAQGAILGVNAGVGGAGTGVQATDVALEVAGSDTTSALGVSADKTGGALKRSSKDVWGALKKSARKTGGFLEGKRE